MVAGCEISVSTPPRLSPSEQSADAGEERLRGLEGAEVERDHRAEAAHLALRELVLRVVGETRVVDLPHLRVAREELRDRARRSPRAASIRTASVLIPRSTSQESKGDRIAPEPFWTKPSHSTCSLILRHRDAADRVGVAVQELRRRVHHDVRAERERPLEVRATRTCCRRRRARRARARSRTRAAMSQSVIIGFVGVSRKSSCVFGRMRRADHFGVAPCRRR